MKVLNCYRVSVSFLVGRPVTSIWEAEASKHILSQCGRINGPACRTHTHFYLSQNWMLLGSASKEQNCRNALRCATAARGTSPRPRPQISRMTRIVFQKTPSLTGITCKWSATQLSLHPPTPNTCFFKVTEVGRRCLTKVWTIYLN